LHNLYFRKITSKKIFPIKKILFCKKLLSESEKVTVANLKKRWFSPFWLLALLGLYVQLVTTIDYRHATRRLI